MIVKENSTSFLTQMAIIFCLLIFCFSIILISLVNDDKKHCSAEVSGCWLDYTAEITPENDLYKITTAQQLAWVAGQVNLGNLTTATFILHNDIDLAEHFWYPIADNSSSSARFKGIFDGNGYAIKNLQINTNNVSYKGFIGLFGYLDTCGVIQNLKMQSAYLRVDASEVGLPTIKTGILAGYSKCLINNCAFNFSANITTSSERIFYGGVVGDSTNNAKFNKIAIISKASIINVSQTWLVSDQGEFDYVYVNAIINETRAYLSNEITTMDTNADFETNNTAENIALLTQYINTLNNKEISTVNETIIWELDESNFLTFNNKNASQGTSGGVDNQLENPPEAEIVLPELPITTVDMSGITFENLIVDYDNKPHSLIYKGDLPQGVTLINYSPLNTSIDVCDLQIRANFTCAENFQFANGTKNFSMSAKLKINPKPITLSWSVADNYWYNGTEQSPHLISTPQITEFNIAITVQGKGTNVGNYTIVANTTSSNFTLLNNSQSYIILPKNVTVTWNNNTFEYDGNAHCPSANIQEDLELDILSPQINVGEYTATAILKNENTNYLLKNTSFDFNITAKKIQVTWGGNTFTYNGELQCPTATIPEQIELTISTGERNVGSYTATASFKNSNTNFILENASIQYFITPLTINVVWSDLIFEYNKNMQSPTANNSLNIPLKVSGGQQNVGAYTAIAELQTTSSNYRLENKTVEYKIKPKNVTVVWGEKEFIFDGKNQLPTATAEDCELLITQAKINVGEYTAKAELKSPNDNYFLVNDDCTFNIKPKQINVVWHINNTFIYNGQPQSATGDANGINGPLELNFTKFVSAGSYTTIASFSQSQNNYILNNVTKEFTILPKELCINIPDCVSQYGDNLTEISFSYYLEKKPIQGDSIQYQFTLYDKNDNIVTNYRVGSYFVKCAISNTNYTISLKHNTIYTIKPREVNVVWTVGTYYYNGLPQTPNYIIQNVCEGEQVTLDYLKGPFTNACEDDYKLEYQLTGEDADNYQIASTENNYIFYKILPKNVTVVWGNNEFIYDNEYHLPTATVNSGINEVDVQISINGKQKNAGSYLAQIECENYNFSLTNTECDFTINRKSINVIFSTNSLIYNGVKQCPTATANSGINEIDLVLEVTGGEIDVGIYSATAICSNQNFTLLNNSQDYEILPKEVTVEWTNISLQYNDTIQCPTAYVNSGIHGIGLELQTSGAQKHVGEHTASVSCANHNFCLQNKTCVYQILAKSLELSWGKKELVYNGEKQCPFVTTNTGIDGLSIQLVYSNKECDVGNYTVNASCSNNNFVLTNTSTNYTITPLYLDVIWEKENYTFSNKVQSPTATCAHPLAPSLEITGAGILAGQYTAVASFTSQQDNIKINNPNCLFIIQPKEIQVHWSNTTLVENGKEQCPTATVNSAINGINLTCKIDGANSVAGNYIATATLNEINNNFVLSNTNCQYTIIAENIDFNKQTVSATNSITGEFHNVIISECDDLILPINAIFIKSFNLAIDGGHTVLPEETVISINIKDLKLGDNTKLLLYTDDTIIELDYQIVDNKIIFNTNKLGVICLAEMDTSINNHSLMHGGIIAFSLVLLTILYLNKKLRQKKIIKITKYKR